MRGARFALEDDDTLEPRDDRSQAIADAALEDVARWLGFQNTSEYVYALSVERAHIFDRATP